jgi:hypothetical protein
VKGPQAEPTIEGLAIEQALTGALAALGLARPVVACATTSHGELPLEPTPEGIDWAMIADRLRAEGITVESVALATAVPAHCNVLIVAGPAVPLSATEALAVQSFVRAGGGLVVAAASRTLVGGSGATGLEAVLAAEGLGIAPAVAFDPESGVGDPREYTLLLVDGYSDHSINAGFSTVRPMLWTHARPVLVEGAAKPLVSTGRKSWGERAYPGDPIRDEDDLAGPLALAAVGTRRVIAIGSEGTFATKILQLGVSASDLWFARAVRFASGLPEPNVAVAERSQSQVRLVLTPGQRNAVVAVSVAGIPLVWAVLGGAFVMWRRRRAAK